MVGAGGHPGISEGEQLAGGAWLGLPSKGEVAPLWVPPALGWVRRRWGPRVTPGLVLALIKALRPSPATLLGTLRM